MVKFPYYFAAILLLSSVVPRHIAAYDIGKVGAGTFSKGDTIMEIQSSTKGAGYEEVFVRAWEGVEQVGFGKDGTVEIERFRIFNPPTLIQDDNGEIERKFELPDGEMIIKKYTYDPQESLKYVLANVIKKVGKDGKNIVKGKVGNTTSVFFPTGGDGGVSIGTSAGYTTWSGARSATTGGSTNTQALFMQTFYNAGGSPGQYGLSRVFLPIDTSSLDGQDLVSASLTLKLSAQSIASSRTWVLIADTSQNSTSTLVNDDFDNCGDLNSPIEISDRVLSSNWSVDNSYSFTINEAGLDHINKTGVSMIGMRDAIYDVDNGTPTNNTWQQFYSYYQTGTVDDPYLTVEHETPVASSSSAPASSAPASSSSSTPAALSGSLILLHNACNEYILNGSGDSVGCNQWDTSIEISAIYAMQKQNALNIIAGIVISFRWFLYMVVLFLITRWLFRILTHARFPKR